MRALSVSVSPIRPVMVAGLLFFAGFLAPAVAGGTACGGGAGAPEDASKVPVDTVTAGSTLKDAKNRYKPAHLMDGSTSSWCEGAAGNGVGETITVTFVRPVSLRKFHVKNGFGDSRHWKSNGRVKSLEANGKTVSLADRPEYQTVEFAEPVVGKSITLKIASVYKGAKFEDTCLTEIAFIPETEPVDTRENAWMFMKWEVGSKAFASVGTCAQLEHKASLTLMKDGSCSYEGYALDYRQECGHKKEVITKVNTRLKQSAAPCTWKLSGANKIEIQWKEPVPGAIDEKGLTEPSFAKCSGPTVFSFKKAFGEYRFDHVSGCLRGAFMLKTIAM